MDISIQGFNDEMIRIYGFRILGCLDLVITGLSIAERLRDIEIKIQIDRCEYWIYSQYLGLRDVQILGYRD